MYATFRRIILDIAIILYVGLLSYYCIGSYKLLQDQQRAHYVISDMQLRILHYSQKHKPEAIQGTVDCPECLDYLRKHERLFEPATVIYTSEYKELKDIKKRYEALNESHPKD